MAYLSKFDPTYNYKRDLTTMEKGPLVHLNGTDGQNLLREYLAAEKACQIALKTCREATFHKRDYYPLGEEVWLEAQHEHFKHIKALDAARDYFAGMAARIFTQTLTR